MLGEDLLATASTLRSPEKCLEVFNIPELAEMILLHLCPKELLAVMPICRSIAASVTSSPKIQAELGLRANVKSMWHTNFFNATTPNYDGGSDAGYRETEAIEHLLSWCALARH